ncbi:carbohydrate ABC transporter permease [Lactonifactor longoviformis]|uniref:Carbohydrate ABC transporter membrane protein 2, CUT1 family (TC 3.A.1.1.-) n=2 Tax=Lactonifactor TaxID=420345 RepID=A0A1M5BN11_9CLOT|nr:carbohydrate ABC transporter permease [Lactonifactor longoviformis]SHF43796.1 carbohydrate ABC transporter membrane protein 2, CUT1 family (TC 3.A.1.1.-) [Lactonifactor longoviformis DSM 17459]
MEQKKRGEKALMLAGKVLLVFYTLFAVFPLIWMIIIAFKGDSQMYDTLFIFHPTLANFKNVLTKGSYVKAFVSNLIISGGAVLVSVLVGVPAAYALARYEFKHKEGVAFTILSFKFAPEILIIIPVFTIFQKLKLYDTYFGMIWIYQFIGLPLLIWVLRGYFEDIPVEMERAAELDGYSKREIFFKMLIPLIRPGLVAAALLSFIFCWNNFTFGLMLCGFKIQTITVSALTYISTSTIHYGQMAVVSVIAIIPEIIMCLCIQKHLVRGLSFGAVKG